jgi:hypothetical protein
MAAREISRPVELAWAAVAWTQFLISITVIDKADMKLIGKFWRTLLYTPAVLLSDFRPFGSVALLLNVISLALFSFLLMAWHSLDQPDFDVDQYRRRARDIAVMALLFWSLSFLALLCYFNPILAVVAFLLVLFVGGAWMGRINRYKTKPQRSGSR